MWGPEGIGAWECGVLGCAGARELGMWFVRRLGGRVGLAARTSVMGDFFFVALLTRKVNSETSLSHL